MPDKLEREIDRTIDGMLNEVKAVLEKGWDENGRAKYRIRPGYRLARKNQPDSISGIWVSVDEFAKDLLL